MFIALVVHLAIIQVKISNLNEHLTKDLKIIKNEIMRTQVKINELEHTVLTNVRKQKEIELMQPSAPMVEWPIKHKRELYHEKLHTFKPEITTGKLVRFTDSVTYGDIDGKLTMHRKGDISKVLERQESGVRVDDGSNAWWPLYVLELWTAQDTYPDQRDINDGIQKDGR